MSETPEQEARRYRRMRFSSGLMCIALALMTITNIHTLWRIAEGGTSWPLGLAANAVAMSMFAFGQSLMLWDVYRKKAREA